MEKITSRQNQIVKTIKKLLTDKKTRYGSRSFFVDGVNFVKKAVDAGWQIEKLVYVAEKIDNDYKKAVLDGVEDTKKIEVSAEIYQEFATKDLIQGVGAVVKMRESELEKRLTVVLEQPQSPGNLGTIMRTMVGLGATQLAIVGPSADLYAPETVRASMGAIFETACQHFASTEEALAWSKAQKMQNWAFDLQANLSLASQWQTVSTSDQLAIWFGNEGRGLSQEVIGEADKRIRIETNDRIDSLNLSESVGIGLYTLLKK